MTKCYECNDCLKTRDGHIKKCAFGENVCKMSISGLTEEKIRINRTCGPSNTALHECIGIRDDLKFTDYPQSSSIFKIRFLYS